MTELERCRKRAWVKKATNKYKNRIRHIRGELGCCVCGIKNHVVLEFHHINPEKKLFDVSQKVVKYQILCLELAKCVILCRNCHAQVEAGEIQVPSDAPRASEYMKYQRVLWAELNGSSP